MIIFTFFYVSSNIYKSGNSCWGQQNSCLYYIFYHLILHCRQYKEKWRRKRQKSKSRKNILKKKWFNPAFEFTVLSRTKQVTPNLTAFQFRSMLPCSMTETPSFLHHSPIPRYVGKVGLQARRMIHSPKRPYWKLWGLGLRTKPLHPLAFQSRGAPVLFCEIQNYRINTRKW